MSRHNLKKTFRDLGIVKINKFFNKQKIKIIKKNILVLKNDIKDRSIMRYTESSILDKNKQILIRIENFYLYSNFFNSLIKSKKLMKILNDLTDSNWSLFKEKINFKPKGCRADKLHQDIQSGWKKYAKNFISILISVDSSEFNNGCLEFDISGNNVNGLKGSLFTPLKVKDLKKPKFLKFPLKSGDIIIFNGFIPHRSKKNFTNRPRTQIYLTYFNGKKINDNVRNKYLRDKRKKYPPNSERDINKSYVYRV